MIVDIHTHTWQYPDHFTDDFRQQARTAKGGGDLDLTVTYEAYCAAALACDRTVVFGGKARLSGLWVDDRYVAEYVAAHSDRCIGFLSVDPTQDGWEEEMRCGHRELGLQGIKLLPMYAGFYPHEERLDPLWRYAVEQDLPVLLHTGTTFVSQAPLDCTLPRHIDAVARRYPEARIVMAHLSHPYEGECVAVIRKHPNVYAEITFTTVTNRCIEFLVEATGEDRVVFGSDQSMRDPRQQLGWVVWADLPVETRHKVLGGNFQRILDRVRLPGP